MKQKHHPEWQSQRLKPANKVHPICSKRLQNNTQSMKEKRRRWNWPTGKSRRPHRWLKERNNSKQLSIKRLMTSSPPKKVYHHQELCTTKMISTSRISGYQELHSSQVPKSSSLMPPSSSPEAVNMVWSEEMEPERLLWSMPSAVKNWTKCHKTSIFSR